MNEKFAPELLESKCEIVECVVEQLEHMVRAACLRVTKDKNAKGSIGMGGAVVG